MTISHIHQFLREATVPDETESPLGPDCLYGLYTSWCLLHSISPLEDLEFRAAIRRQGIVPGSSRRRMAGPAATDYILASYPVTA